MTPDIALTFLASANRYLEQNPDFDCVEWRIARAYLAEHARAEALEAERDRLARILAVERGDESAAPAGWGRVVDALDGQWLWDSEYTGAQVWYDPQEYGDAPWRVWRKSGSTYTSDGESDRYSTALAGMDAADDDSREADDAAGGAS